MSAPALSTTQREAIRWIHDHGSADGFGQRTVDALRRRGLIEPDGIAPSASSEADPVQNWALTARGQRAYERIMASGDGPEALKALLRW